MRNSHHGLFTKYIRDRPNNYVTISTLMLVIVDPLPFYVTLCYATNHGVTSPETYLQYHTRGNTTRT